MGNNAVIQPFTHLGSLFHKVTDRSNFEVLCAVASRRFRRGKKAIFKEPVFKAQASLGDKSNLISSTSFQRSPYDEAYCSACPWTPVFVYEKEYVERVARYCSNAGVYFRVLDELLVLFCQ